MSQLLVRLDHQPRGAGLCLCCASYGSNLALGANTSRQIIRANPCSGHHVAPGKFPAFLVPWFAHL